MVFRRFIAGALVVLMAITFTFVSSAADINWPSYSEEVSYTHLLAGSSPVTRFTGQLYISRYTARITISDLTFPRSYDLCFMCFYNANTPSFSPSNFGALGSYYDSSLTFSGVYPGYLAGNGPKSEMSRSVICYFFHDVPGDLDWTIYRSSGSSLFYQTLSDGFTYQTDGLFLTYSDELTAWKDLLELISSSDSYNSNISNSIDYFAQLGTPIGLLCADYALDLLQSRGFVMPQSAFRRYLSFCELSWSDVEDGSLSYSNFLSNISNYYSSLLTACSSSDEALLMMSCYDVFVNRAIFAQQSDFYDSFNSGLSEIESPVSDDDAALAAAYYAAEDALLAQVDLDALDVQISLNNYLNGVSSTSLSSIVSWFNELIEDDFFGPYIMIPIILSVVSVLLGTGLVVISRSDRSKSSSGGGS